MSQQLLAVPDAQQRVRNFAIPHVRLLTSRFPRFDSQGGKRRTSNSSTKASRQRPTVWPLTPNPEASREALS
ncbi:MAG: hypothetical protein LC126_12960 [Bryobacterales bacterium]|nr:hypothetical protein [Bryobacterales bacterium]